MAACAARLRFLVGMQSVCECHMRFCDTASGSTVLLSGKLPFIVMRGEDRGDTGGEGYFPASNL